MSPTYKRLLVAVDAGLLLYWTAVFLNLIPEHLCMSMRGVRKPGSNTVTSAVRGIMRNAATRSEAMSLVLGRRS